MNDAKVRDPNASDGRLRRILSSVLLGVAFGMLFPLVSTVIALMDQGASITASNVMAAHKSSPLLQVIDTIPLMLGVAFGLLGRAMAKLDFFIENLEGTVVQRDLVLKRSKNQAETARKAKGALLGRLSQQIRSEHSKGEPFMESLLNAGLPLEVQRALKGVARAQQKVQASLWNLDMLAHVEASQDVQAQDVSCSPHQLCEHAAQESSQRVPGGLRYKVTADHDVPPRVWVPSENVARTFSCLLQCAMQRSTRNQIEINLSHFAAIHGGISKLHVAIRNPSTPTVNSVVRSFADLNPNAESQERGELELALCRQLAHSHQGEVGVRPDPKGGMCYWMLFPYRSEGGSGGRRAGEVSQADSQDLVRTEIAAG